MASIKVKFRPSTNENKEGTIYYQVIQNRVIRQLKTYYRLFMHEWDEDNNAIITTNNSRQNYLQSIEERIDWDIKRLQSIINQYENKHVKYIADDIISTFQKQSNEQSLFNFMQGVIAQLQQMGKQRTSETYRCTLKSFMQFRENKDVLLGDIDSDLMLMYEAYLRNKGLTKNSTSFYMRILRAVYNRAVEKDLTTNRNPFKHVYTGIDKTIKRAIPLKAIKQIKNLNLSLQPSLDFARDMFLFSSTLVVCPLLIWHTSRRKTYRIAYYHTADVRPGNSSLSVGRNVCRRLWISTIAIITARICYLFSNIHTTTATNTRMHFIAPTSR